MLLSSPCESCRSSLADSGSSVFCSLILTLIGLKVYYRDIVYMKLVYIKLVHNIDLYWVSMPVGEEL